MTVAAVCALNNRCYRVSATFEVKSKKVDGPTQRVSGNRTLLTVVSAESMVCPQILEQLERRGAGTGGLVQSPRGLNQTATFVGVDVHSFC